MIQIAGSIGPESYHDILANGIESVHESGHVFKLQVDGNPEAEHGFLLVDFLLILGLLL